mmetsp:Transcript_164345/g.527065  ORF Transcript_164345/g.527065 Transcript_164345/m.527065 type:complete len:117 (-) Transcript_164345:154-504(-)
MEQVALPQCPRSRRHALRPKPQLVVASSADTADGRMLEEAEQEAEEEQLTLALAITMPTPPGGFLVPGEPQGPRPANRRPAQTKTVAVRSKTAGGEKPEEPMASGGHGGSSRIVSL